MMMNSGLSGVVREKTDQFLEQDENEVEFEFIVLKDIDEVKETYGTLYLNNSFFHYRPDIGFNKEKRGTEKSNRKERKDKKNFIHAYRKDTFNQQY